METQTMPNTQISLRIDSELKKQADAILTQLGLTTSDYTRLALHQLVLQRGLPFPVQVPSGQTAAPDVAGEAATATE